MSSESQDLCDTFSIHTCHLPDFQLRQAGQFQLVPKEHPTLPSQKNTMTSSCSASTFLLATPGCVFGFHQSRPEPDFLFCFQLVNDSLHIYVCK